MERVHMYWNSLSERNIRLRTIIVGIVLVLVAIAFMGADSSCNSQTNSSFDSETNAGNIWGTLPNITKYTEYHQLKTIYELRDDPNIILNAYLYSQVTGQLTCFGQMKGYGIPYGTSWSQDIGGGTTGSVPEPNALFPSKSTNADWTQSINPDGSGTVGVGFIEPDMIITPFIYPCHPLTGVMLP